MTQHIDDVLSFRDGIIEAIMRKVVEPAFNDKSLWTKTSNDTHKMTLEVDEIKEGLAPILLERVRGHDLGVFPWNRANDADYVMDGGRLNEGKLVLVVSAKLRPRAAMGGVIGMIDDYATSAAMLTSRMSGLSMGHVSRSKVSPEEIEKIAELM